MQMTSFSTHIDHQKRVPTTARPTDVSLWIAAFAIGVISLSPTNQLLAQSDGAAQRLMIQAQRLADDGRIDEAIAEYQRVADALPDDSSAPNAVLNVARLELLRNRSDRALQVANDLLERYPQSPAAASAAVLRTEVIADEANSEEELGGAVADLRALLLRYDRGRYPTLSARAEALTLTGSLHLRLNEPMAAAAVLVEVLEDEPVGDYTPRAHLLFAQAQIRTGNAGDAWQSLQIARESKNGRVAAEATSLATLLHRFVLRPQVGEPLWRGARTLTAAGAALKKPTAVAANDLGDLIVIDSSTGGFVRLGESVQALPSLRDAERPFFQGRAPSYVMPASVDQPGLRDTFKSGGTKPKDLTKLVAAARGSYGEWFLIDRSLDGLATYDRLRSWRGGRSVDGKLVDLATNDVGHLYLLTSRPNQIQVFNAQGTQVATHTAAAGRPLALDVDALGNMYVLDEQRKSVQVLDAAGESIATIGPILPNGTELRSPEDLAVDGAGRIHIADSRLGAVLILE